MGRLLAACDWNYAYASVSFVIGALAGFQAVYERYGDESGTSICTLPGIGYLFSRGIVPALSFVFVYRNYQVHNFLFGIAIGLGLGTEALLRSQFQVKTSKSAKDSLVSENTFIGLFRFLDWYQKFILEAINTRIAAKRQKIVQNAVTKLPLALNFNAVCKRVEMNAGAVNTEQERDAIKAEIQKQFAEYQKEIAAQGSTPELEERYRYKLGYWIYKHAGRWHGLNVLFKFQ